MENKIVLNILRYLALFLGIFILVISLFSCFVLGDYGLWVGLVLGPIFLLYGIFGKAKFEKIYTGNSRDVI